MKHWMSLAFMFVFLPMAWAAPSDDQVLEETLYQDFKYLIQKKQINNRTGLIAFDQSLFVDALWDSLDEGTPGATDVLDQVKTFQYELVEKLRIAILRIKYSRATTLPVELVNDLVNVLRAPEVETKLIYTLAAYEKEILVAGHADVIELARAVQMQDQRPQGKPPSTPATDLNSQ